MPKQQPAYIQAYETGLLQQNAEKAHTALGNCTLCPRDCEVDRLTDETGICKTGERAILASYAPHFGEESPLVGHYGSGTIFFTHCNLLCTFCQNYDISHEGLGREMSKSHLARIMLELQNMGCHNINFVTPSHVVPQILSALEIAVKHGLNIPLVYNSGGYDHVSTLELLDGIVDIYMPDLKFFDREVASRTCHASDYPEIVKKAIREMYRQVGELKIKNGLAYRGLLIRHLVMPGMVKDSEKVLEFIAKEISKETYVNIMPQYHPAGTESQFNRRITREEFENTLKVARDKGLINIEL